MSPRRWLILLAALLIGGFGLLNQMSAAHRRSQVQQFVASLDQQVEPELLRRWAMALIAGRERGDSFRPTNAPVALTAVYGHVPWASVWETPGAAQAYVMLSSGRTKPALAVGSTNLTLEWGNALKWRDGIYVLRPRD